MSALGVLKQRYLAAMHAMQTGVMMLLDRDAPGWRDGLVPDRHEASPKHLRVGVNSALLDSGALQKVLIDKGLITAEEFLAALCELVDGDVESYRRKLNLPPNVTLG
jgi:hypothetical protein